MPLNCRFVCFLWENPHSEISAYLLFWSYVSFVIVLSPVFLSTFSFREKTTSNIGDYCYHYSYTSYSIISLCCSCLFCRGILLSVWMSENKSCMVREEVSLASKIRGHAEICQLHLNMRWSRLHAKHKGEKRNNCSDQNPSRTPMPLFMLEKGFEKLWETCIS